MTHRNTPHESDPALRATTLAWLASIAIQLPAAAQTPVAVVASESAGTTALSIVDIQAGTVSPIGPIFSGMDQPPLCVAWDPIDHSILLATDNGPGTSAIHRIHVRGSTVTTSRRLAVVSGQVTALASRQQSGDVLIARTGVPSDGLWGLPRFGQGPAWQIAAIPAIADFCHYGRDHALVISHGTATSPPAVWQLQLSTGAVLTTGLPGALSRQMTGIGRFVLTPSSLPVYSDDGGRLYMGNSVQIAGPPQATRDIRVTTDGAFALVVGVSGQPTPALYTHRVGSQQVALVATNFNGDPVALDVWWDYGRGNIRGFGQPCGLSLAGYGPGGAQPPAAGSSIRLLSYGGTPNAWVVFALAAFGGPPTNTLPAGLPGGCTVAIEPLTAGWWLADASGSATVTMTVPASMRGKFLGFQAVELHPNAWPSSNGVSFEIAR
ncbi:MAG: hypothetical protein NXI31_19520 [bacterium]|nr:hypothetical protein [bacterium]